MPLKRFQMSLGHWDLKLDTIFVAHQPCVSRLTDSPSKVWLTGTESMKDYHPNSMASYWYEGGSNEPSPGGVSQYKKEPRNQSQSQGIHWCGFQQKKTLPISHFKTSPCFNCLNNMISMDFPKQKITGFVCFPGSLRDMFVFFNANHETCAQNMSGNAASSCLCNLRLLDFAEYPQISSRLKFWRERYFNQSFFFVVCHGYCWIHIHCPVFAAHSHSIRSQTESMIIFQTLLGGAMWVGWRASRSTQ